MITYRKVFCVLTIYSAVVKTNTAPIEFLKVMFHGKHSIDGQQPSSSRPTTQSNVTVAKVAAGVVTTVTTASGGRPSLSMTSRDVYVHVVKTDVPRPSSTVDSNAMVKKLCAVLMRAITMPQNRRKVDQMTTATVGRVYSPSVTIATTGYSKTFRKKFLSLAPHDDMYDKSVATRKTTTCYKDPIMIQELSQLDYLPSYPLKKDIYNADIVQKYNGDSDKPTRAWKTIVVGKARARSMKNRNMISDDDEYDDDNGDGGDDDDDDDK